METIKINPQYVTDNAGNKLGVFLTTADFQRLLDELEDLEDIKAFNEATSRVDEEFIPFDQAVEEIEKGLIK